MILALSIFVPFALHVDFNNKFLLTFLLFILHLCKLFVCYAIFVAVVLLFSLCLHFVGLASYACWSLCA